VNFSMRFMRPKSDARRTPLPAALVDRRTARVIGQCFNLIVAKILGKF